MVYLITPVSLFPAKGELEDLDANFSTVHCAFGSKITTSAVESISRFPAFNPYFLAGFHDMQAKSCIMLTFPVSTRLVMPRESAVSNPIIPLGASVSGLLFSSTL